MNRTAPKVLIVDDLEENLILLETLLAEIDVEMDLELVQSPLDVLDKIDNEEYAVVLTDIHMPTMDGFEFAMRLRDSKKNQSTPIIFLTAFYLDKDSEQRGYNCGCADFMQKPYDPIILRNKLKLFIDLYNSKKETDIQNQRLNGALQEKELLESKVKELARNYRSILEGQSELILKVDALLKIEFANKAFTNFFNFTLDVLFQNTIGDISEKLEIQLKESFYQMNADQKTLVVEQMLTDCNNDERLIEWTINRQSDFSNVYYLIVGRDITQRDKLREALVNKEDKWQKIERKTGVCSLEWDSYTRILKASDAFYTMFGKSKSDNIKESVLGNIEKEDYDDFHNLFFNFPKSEQEELTYNRKIRVCYSENKIKYLDIDIFCRHNAQNNVSRVLLLIEDITSKVNFEVAVRDTLSLRKEIYDNRVFFEINENKKIRYLSKYGQEFFGIDDYSELTISELNEYIADEDKDFVENLFSFEKSNYAFESFSVIRLNGEIVRVIVGVYRVLIDDEYIVRVLLHELIKAELIADALEEKRTPFIIGKSNIEENNANINASIDNDLGINEYQRKLLEQKSELEVLGEMASVVVHEINQPLSAMSMALDNILLRLERSYDKDYLLQKINMMFNDIGRIKTYLSQIPIYISESKQQKVDELVDMNAVIIGVCSLIKKKYRSSKVNLVKELSDEVLPVHNDKYKLQKVFVGLFSNSFEALNSGKQKKENKKITIVTKKEDNFVVVSITDNGKGIAPENMNYIFEPFYSTKKGGDNSGLGLYVIKDIITQMGGEITVSSEEGEFTKMDIKVPIDEN